MKLLYLILFVGLIARGDALLSALLQALLGGTSAPNTIDATEGANAAEATNAIEATKAIKVNEAPTATYRLAAEWEPHKRTFMCWPRSANVWGDDLLLQVWQDIARLSAAIVPFEPVVMFVDPSQVDIAREYLDPRIELAPIAVDDLWARDTLPVFVNRIINGGESIAGAVFNFNGWGAKQPCNNDAKLAKNVNRREDLPSITADMIAEGGSFETDGKGTLLVTRSSILNQNRNNKTEAEINKELKRCLGIRKIIWLKGVYNQDITDAHVDCAVRFVKPGVVIVSRPFPKEEPDCWSEASDDTIRVLSNSTDADGNPFKIVELCEPDRSKVKMTGNKDTFLTTYVNFLIGNGFVAIPEFGDPEADLNAQKVIQALFPDRKVVGVQIPAIASGGGGIHCATHEQPLVKPGPVT